MLIGAGIRSFMEHHINFPFLILLGSHIEIVPNERIGWLSNSEIFSAFSYRSARLIDAAGKCYKIENIRLAGIKILSPAHIFNLVPFKRAPRSVQFDSSLVSTLTLPQVKSLVMEHIKTNALFARPDYGSSLGKFYDFEQIEVAEDFFKICDHAKMSMNRKYMRLFYNL